MAVERRGIILAGGSGSRLYPLTVVTSKQLLPVYNKPMIYYPLSTLLLLGIREIALITTPRDHLLFRTLLGDGAALGIRLTYLTQAEPRGIAEALLLAEEFLAGQSCCLILGDNIFYGDYHPFRRAIAMEDGAAIFGYQVADPARYGVIEFDEETGTALSLEEKPAVPRSNYAVPGLYFYDAQAPELVRGLTPSARGELEITDLNTLYLRQGALQVFRLGRGMAWLDAGTPAGLLEISNFIEAIETRQGLRIGVYEEAAYRMGFVDADGLLAYCRTLPPGDYRAYLESVVELPG
ncbi:MAG: glucose-1-phosphate thymidylyltransferase RfbA [Armatimonadota bacterium]